MSISYSHWPRQFFLTQPGPCPYLPNRLERKVVAYLNDSNAIDVHDRLIQAGFRRSHDIAYATVCEQCHACVPFRIAVDTFSPNRTQKRIARKRSSLTIESRAASASKEQYALFKHYQNERHKGGGMASMTWEDYRDLVESSPVKSQIIEFREKDGQLVCASLVDWVSDGLSAVYTFYTCENAKASYGTFAILWLINHVKVHKLPHLYLGYWIAESDKMRYKAQFGAAEILSNGHWILRSTSTSPLGAMPSCSHRENAFQ